MLASQRIGIVTVPRTDQEGLVKTERTPDTAECDGVAQEHAEVDELKARLCAHRAFTDMLHELVEACDDPPSDTELIHLLERSLENIVAATESEFGSLMVQDNDDKTLVLVLHHGAAEPTCARWSPVPRTQGIAHWVARNKRAALVNNAENDARCGPDLNVSNSIRIRSALAVPMMCKGRVLGVVEVLNKRHCALYAMRDQKRMELICRFDGQLLAELVDRSQRSAAQDATKTRTRRDT